MSDFSGLPLVIEPSDLLPRLESGELILVDLTSAARYTEGHLPGAGGWPSWVRFGSTKRAPGR